MALNERQKTFALEYIKDFNATRAYLAAGYGEESAYTNSHKMLKNAELHEYIQGLIQTQRSRIVVTRERIVQELARIAFADPRDYFDFGFNGVELRESAFLTEDQAAAIASVSEKRTKGGLAVEVKFHDKQRALEMLAKHLGMVIDKSEVRAVVANGGEANDRDRAALQHFMKNYGARVALPATTTQKVEDDGMDLV